MANTTIREAAKEFGFKLGEVAEILGISASKFSKKMRNELSITETQYILDRMYDAAHWRDEQLANYLEIRAEQ